ncbi:MAG: pilus assembly protein PilM [Deltaproteobacteria bacterium]|nr:pilus assembly protein PilM [Deltaproteobacteria bacterium]
MKKGTCVGIDIGYHELKLAMVNRASDKRQELIDFISIPYEVGITPNSTKFPHFLRDTLKNFCGRNKKIALWNAISSAKVETRNLKIPKVSKKQIDNATYWTLKKDLSFNEDEMLFDYEVIGDVVEDGINKIEVMAYIAPKQEIAQQKNLFEKIGFPLTGISIIPFALQNLFRTDVVDTLGKDICSLFIGRDWSRIVIYSNGNLVLSRGIKAGIRSMIEAVAQEISKSKIDLAQESVQPSESSIFGIEEESYILDIDEARKIFFDHICNAEPILLEETGHILREHDVFGMIQPALERLVKQVERTLSHYYLHFNKDRVSKVYVSGQMSVYERLFVFMKEQLDIPIDTMNPFSARLNYLGIAPMPETLSEKEAFAPAIGMALSNNSLTPNFIYTYKDKQIADSARKVNQGIIAGILFFLSVCFGLFLWGNNLIDQKKLELAKLQTVVETFKPLVNKNLIIDLASKTRNKRKAIKELGEKYKSVAVINEISAITPPEIRLISISATMHKKPSNGKQSKQQLEVEGVVIGDRITFESTLAGYIVKLKGSPLFQTPSVENKSFKFLDQKEVLLFTAKLDLV